MSKIVLQRQRSQKSDEEKEDRMAMAVNPRGGALKSKPDSVGFLNILRNTPLELC